MVSFDAVIKNTIDLDPEDFLRMKQDHSRDIKSAEIVPPVLGKPGFGKIRVTLRAPRYEVNLDGKR